MFKSLSVTEIIFNGLFISIGDKIDDMKNALAPAQSSSQQILGSMASLFLDYEEKLSGIKLIADFVRGKDELLNYFTTGTKHSLMAKEIFEYKQAKAALNAEFWSKAMNMTDVLECMSAAKRNEWSEMIRDRKTPEFTKETVFTTISTLLLSRGSFISEKVDGIFRSLSGKHVTNSPNGFRQRMIISYVVDCWGSINHDRAEYVHDLRAVIAKIQNRNEPKSWNTRSDLGHIARSEKFGEWHEFDGGAFKVRLYKVGTAHLEVHPEIAVKLNRILASLYPMAIAGEANKLSKREKEVPLMNDILPYEVTNELISIADKLSRRREAYVSKEGLDEKTFLMVREVLEFLGGTDSDGCWSFSYDVAPVLYQIIRTGCLPEKVSHQFYPTKDELAERAVSLLDITDSDNCLEPSAGHGALAQFLPKDRTTCVEISQVNSLILKQKGFNVVTEDFLNWEPKELFSKIVMNPPFAKGKAKRHVEKAASLLKEGGELVAILPASLRNQNLVESIDHEWCEVISGAFDDTNVNVVILKLTKAG